MWEEQSKALSFQSPSLMSLPHEVTFPLEMIKTKLKGIWSQCNIKKGS